MKYLITFLHICLISGLGYSQEVRIKGTVEFSFSQSNIKAGENYQVETASRKDGVVMDIKKLDRQSHWKITVYKNDINWDNRVGIYVRRTSTGNGSGATWGGTNYVEIRSMPQNFLQGSGSLTNINLQYKLMGLSIEIPSNTYYTDIVYTLYEQ